MITYNKVPQSGDPSNRIQLFETLKVNILCCRYWWLERWNSHKMSFPFWRLYWNKTPGAYVYNTEKMSLTPEKIILIPPNTPFSTGITGDHAINITDQYDLVGSWIRSVKEEKWYAEQGKVLHLFIHFNLGSDFDKVEPGIYQLKLHLEQKKQINRIINEVLKDGITFDMYASLDIFKLILSTIQNLPKHALIPRKIDSRIAFLMNYIQDNLNLNLPNEHLAQKISMATNSFTRFFREQLNISPQDYVRQMRIDKSCDMLGHSTLTIDQISDHCGFSDRFHFSKVFKKLKGIAPAEYKRKYILNEI